MKTPIYVREPTPVELTQLREGLLSKRLFTSRRCQIILASADGLRASQIAYQLGCTVQTVQNVIKAFNERGIACLERKIPAVTRKEPLFDEAKYASLRNLLEQSPRDFDFDTCLWNLRLAALACQKAGLTKKLVSIETIRRTLARSGVSWKQVTRKR